MKLSLLYEDNKRADLIYNLWAHPDTPKEEKDAAREAYKRATKRYPDDPEEMAARATRTPSASPTPSTAPRTWDQGVKAQKDAFEQQKQRNRDFDAWMKEKMDSMAAQAEKGRALWGDMRRGAGPGGPEWPTSSTAGSSSTGSSTGSSTAEKAAVEKLNRLSPEKQAKERGKKSFLDMFPSLGGGSGTDNPMRGAAGSV